jgi:hypothetical protein
VADRVFARDGLAGWLAGHGVAFEPFGDLYDVMEALRWRSSPSQSRSTSG